MNIIELAKQAGLVEYDGGVEWHWHELQKFAALVAAHEREECAKICDDGHLASVAADIIRERGEALFAIRE